MNTEYLRSFLEVAANGSFSIAATRLNLAQSTVSARIRGLEENLGQTLFLRESDGIKLTGAGRQFLHHASTILRAWEQARQDIAVPEGYEALLRLTAPVNFWDRIITSWLLLDAGPSAPGGVAPRWELSRYSHGLSGRGPARHLPHLSAASAARRDRRAPGR